MMRRFRQLALLVFLLLCTAVVLAQDGPPPVAWDSGAGTEPIRVVFAGGERAPLTLDGRRLCGGTDLPYLAAADMASLVRAGRFWRDASMSLRLSAAGHEAVFTHGSRLVRLDGRDVVLPTPPFAQEGDLWLPITVCRRVLGPMTGESFIWDAEAVTLTVGGARVNITGLQIDTHGRSTLLKLHGTRALRWSLERPGNDRLRLLIRDGVLERGVGDGVGGHGLVRNVHATQEDGRVVLDVAVLSLTSGARTYSEDGGRTIVLALEESGSGLPAPPVRGERSMGQPEAFAAPPARVSRVVLDPGHGGDDDGVVGSRGRNEKELMLELARDLRDLLKNAGFDVVLTRDGNENLAPDARAERANVARGDIFLSLHAGAWFSRDRRGASAWVLPQGAAVGSGDFAAWETVQQRHRTESALLAEIVLTRLALDAGLAVHDPQPLETPVLRGVDMPAVFVEVGLLSHPEDEETLLDSGRRRRLAASLANAVKAYRASVDERRGLGGEEPE